MTAPANGVFETGAEGGVVYQYINDQATSVQTEYACVTAPAVIECDVAVDDHSVDKVWAGGGGSHSWWTPAGGRLLRYPLKPGQTLRVTLSGKGAFRVNWYE